MSREETVLNDLIWKETNNAAKSYVQPYKETPLGAPWHERTALAAIRLAFKAGVQWSIEARAIIKMRLGIEEGGQQLHEQRRKSA